MPVFANGITLKHIKASQAVTIINNKPIVIGNGNGTGGGSGGIGGTGAYSDLYSPPGSGVSWQDKGTAGQDALINGTVTRVNDTRGTGITTSGTAYISNAINPSSLTNFTVTIICSITQSNFTNWASLFGNETWNSNAGFVAYLTSATNLVFAGGGTSGSVQGTVSNIGATNMWSFVSSGGTSLSIYQNNTLVASGTITKPSSGPTSTYWGCRHGNTGSGQTDYCAGTYRRLMVFNSALNQAGITSNYNALKGPYGLP